MGSIVSYETHTTSTIIACFVHLVDTKADTKVNVNGKAKLSSTSEVISVMYLYVLATSSQTRLPISLILKNKVFL